jgi:hypothetical protein
MYCNSQWHPRFSHFGVDDGYHRSIVNVSSNFGPTSVKNTGLDRTIFFTVSNDFTVQ